jgi:hypothetical protein
MMPTGQGGHAGIEHQFVRLLPECRQRKPGKRRVTLVILPRVEMITGPNTVESSLFRCHGVFRNIWAWRLFVIESEIDRTGSGSVRQHFCFSQQ